MINIYEVMAVESGYPLFFQEHIKRLQRSISSIKEYREDELIDIAVSLISPLFRNELRDNIKLIYSASEDKFSVDLIKSRKPEAKSYITGVELGIIDLIRDNPLIKKENLNQRKICDDICRDKGFYDVLLKNEDGGITEGSRSNFLGIDSKGRVVTSPLGTALNGITREIIFNICSELNIPVIEEIISIKTLNELDSLVITGTSPEILPVRKCGDKTFSLENSVVKLLQSGFSNKKLNNKDIAMGFFKHF